MHASNLGAEVAHLWFQELGQGLEIEGMLFGAQVLQEANTSFLQSHTLPNISMVPPANNHSNTLRPVMLDEFILTHCQDKWSIQCDKLISFVQIIEQWAVWEGERLFHFTTQDIAGHHWIRSFV